MVTNNRRKRFARRLGRQLFTAASAVSLALCMLLTGLWVRQQFVKDRWSWQFTSHSHSPDALAAGQAYDFLSGSNGMLFFGQHCEIMSRLDIVAEDGFAHTTGEAHWADLVPSLFNVSYKAYVPDAAKAWHLVASSGEYSYSTSRGKMIAVELPTWSPIVASAVLPLLWGLRHRRALRARRRAAQTLCPACGYDLRATPGRCPECGARRKHTIEPQAV